MHTLAEAPARNGRRFMPEIQGLRAVAVGLVVLFHLWPAEVPGGFVGVDVFFVISGYLITSHLMREVDATGTVRLGSFYARRARRLLPASLLVLAVSGIAAALILPAQLARSAMREVVASAVYVENLWLASQAVTYSASNDTASPLQHYWSLSTEEQFYALWPALILVAVQLARRAGRGGAGPDVGRTRRAVAGVLLALAAASLVHSIVLTASDPAAAYFVTTTRAWEFAAGALLSFVMARWTPSGAAAVGLRWAGLAAVVATSFAISQATPFPGAVALVPVLGTAAIILAGDARPSDPLLRVGNLRPVQWLGDVSYAVYLWHWPLIALGPFVLGRELSAVDKAAILVITGVLAHLTRRFVEQPFLTGFPRLVGTPRRTLISTVLAMAIVAGGALGHGAWLDHVGRVQLQERLAQLSSDPCVGASAALDPARCGPPFAAPPRAPVSEADSPLGDARVRPGMLDRCPTRAGDGDRGRLARPDPLPRAGPDRGGRGLRPGAVLQGRVPAERRRQRSLARAAPRTGRVRRLGGPHRGGGAAAGARSDRLVGVRRVVLAGRRRGRPGLPRHLGRAHGVRAGRGGARLPAAGRRLGPRMPGQERPRSPGVHPAARGRAACRPCLRGGP